MRQCKKISDDDYSIDSRKKKDILDKIRELAASYTPEWQFSEQDPDIGSVLALLFADQMQENIRRYNLTIRKAQVELVNLLGLSPRSACPAHSIVVMDMIPNTVPGQTLPAGSKFLADGEGDAALVFETSHGIYLTDAQIKCMFMASGTTGKVIPLKKEETFTLFDFDGKGYGRTGLVMYHSHLFDEADNDIRMEIIGADGLIDEIIRGNYRLSYYGMKGFCPVTDLRREQDRYLVFRTGGACRKVIEEGKTYSLLSLEPAGAPETDVMAEDIRFSASGNPTPVEYVTGGIGEMEAERFYPFGRALTLFAEVSIGHRYFGNPGAVVTLSFVLSYEEIVVKMPGEEVDEGLKVIKRRPERNGSEAVTDVFADEVSFSYYNGIGWRKLTLETPTEALFRQEKTGACQIRFICPADWQETETGSFTGRCIRIRLLRSDNCYYQPSVHHCPVIRHMRVAYDYRRRFVRPQKLVRFQGSREWDITERIAQGGSVPILLKNSYHETALYLGFDRKPEDGPVGLLFRIKESGDERKGRLRVTYSARTGFSRLKMTDYTDGFAHTGILLFLPPADMAKREIEGQDAYWIRITDEDFIWEKDSACRPVIEEVAVNAAKIDNIETLPEEEYYIDVCEPEMSFPIAAGNILQVEVWVNETLDFSGSEMKRFMMEHPSDARAEYDQQGNLCEFYIKWREVDHFDHSRPGDRHFVVDRIARRICFGDGVNVRIPKNIAGPAFKTVVRCCDGARANVPAGSVNDCKGNVLFVKNIRNPENAFGGMDRETMEDTLRRGTAMFNSRSRLVSVLDYEREVLDFSHSISQVRLVTGVRRDGSVGDGSVFVVVLMEDYKDGPASFVHLKKRLKEHLLTRCELTVAPEQLEIVEPLYVEISVEVWIRAAEAEDYFAVQQTFLHILTDYLDPVKNSEWEIGGQITENQIRLRLNREKRSAMIRRILVSGRYRDQAGWHETELKSLGGNPYMLVVSGHHRVCFE